MTWIKGICYFIIGAMSSLTFRWYGFAGLLLLFVAACSSGVLGLVYEDKP